MDKSILVVDDTRSMRKMVAAILAGAGYEVAEAGDGEEALELAQARRFDLVVTDHNMPRMDGVTLVRALRQLSTYDGVALIVLSTEVDPVLKQKGREAGATGWMAKPFDPQRMLDIVGQVHLRPGPTMYHTAGGLGDPNAYRAIFFEETQDHLSDVESILLRLAPGSLVPGRPERDLPRRALHQGQRRDARLRRHGGAHAPAGEPAGRAAQGGKAARARRRRSDAQGRRHGARAGAVPSRHGRRGARQRAGRGDAARAARAPAHRREGRGVRPGGAALRGAPRAAGGAHPRCRAGHDAGRPGRDGHRERGGHRQPRRRLGRLRGAARGHGRRPAKRAGAAGRARTDLHREARRRRARARRPPPCCHPPPRRRACTPTTNSSSIPRNSGASARRWRSGRPSRTTDDDARGGHRLARHGHGLDPRLHREDRPAGEPGGRTGDHRSHARAQRAPGRGRHGRAAGRKRPGRPVAPHAQPAGGRAGDPHAADLQRVLALSAHRARAVHAPGQAGRAEVRRRDHRAGPRPDREDLRSAHAPGAQRDRPRAGNAAGARGRGQAGGRDAAPAGAPARRQHRDRGERRRPRPGPRAHPGPGRCAAATRSRRTRPTPRCGN